MSYLMFTRDAANMVHLDSDAETCELSDQWVYIIRVLCIIVYMKRP